MSERLKPALTEQLAPATAPDELWSRIQAGKAAGVERPRKQPVASIFLTVLTVSASLLLMIMYRPALNMEQMAVTEMRSDQPLDFVSSDANAINAWLRRNSGLEVTIPGNPGVRLCGARVVTRNGVRIGEVAYRVQGDEARLLVAHSSAPQSHHGRLSWTSHGQTYALACSNATDLGVACRLCHTNLMRVN